MNQGHYGSSQPSTVLVAPVVNLDDKRTQPPRLRKFALHDKYLCSSCETERFILLSSGEICCAQCGKSMDNIYVAEMPHANPQK